MHFDLSALLVFSVLITGGIWLFDIFYLAPRRSDADLKAQTPSTHPAPPRKQSALVEYSKSFFPVLLIVLLLRSFIVEPFRIPSGSMMPTLLVGDFILVNKFAYGLRLPVLDWLVYPIAVPKQGDVLVFRYPKDPSVDYIKRVIGVPGDRVSYHNKTLYVNGQKIAQIPLGHYTGVGSGARMTGASLMVEKMASEHQILTNPYAPDFAPHCDFLLQGDTLIPEGHYFVMGDNRDNSNDGRCWGLVPDANLVGKAFMIWMNWDYGIAWGRIGQSIQ